MAHQCRNQRESQLESGTGAEQSGQSDTDIGLEGEVLVSHTKREERGLERTMNRYGVLGTNTSDIPRDRVTDSFINLGNLGFGLIKQHEFHLPKT